MSIKGLILQQFSNGYDENGWFVAARNAIAGLNVEQACWKPDHTDINCIWEILSHITYYNNAYLQRFKGIDHKYDVSTNNETFSVGEYEEAEWQADIERFDAVMTEWRKLITAADERKFDESVSETDHRSWAILIGNINDHNAYHAGQILLLRKLQGIWNPEHGVS